jgi:hypothetical protein
MRTLEDQISLLEYLLNIAKQHREAGETEWLEFKTNLLTALRVANRIRLGEKKMWVYIEH